MQESRENEVRKSVSHMKWVLILSVVILVIGLTGYLLLPSGFLLTYAFAHLGALGLLGLFGGAAGFLAIKKRRSFWIAFSLVSLLPIFSGIIAVAIAGDSITCGGSFSLAIAVLMTATYAPSRKKTPTIPA